MTPPPNARGIARIVVPTADGMGVKHVGMAIVVDDRYVMTCCHVLNDALGRTDRLAPDRPPPDSRFAVRFPYADNARGSGKVVEWGLERQMPRDVAVLELEAEAPDAAGVAEFSRADVQLSQNWFCNGWDVKGVERGAGGTFGAVLSNGELQLNGPTGVAVRIAPGYSGAGVWSDDLKAFVGVVATIDREQHETGVSYAIPTASLLDVWSELALARGPFKSPAVQKAVCDVLEATEAPANAAQGDHPSARPRPRPPAKRFPPDQWIALPHTIAPKVEVRRRLTEWGRRQGAPVRIVRGLTGTGKSVATWLWAHFDIAPGDAPPLGLDPVLPRLRFDGVLWWTFDPRDQDLQSGTGAGGPDLFFQQALAYFSGRVGTQPSDGTGLLAADALFDLVQRHRLLLVIDSLEGQLLGAETLGPTPNPPRDASLRFRCRDQKFSRFLRRLADPSVRSKVLVTTQMFPAELLDDSGQPVQGVEEDPLDGYSPEEAAGYLRNRGLRLDDQTLSELARTYQYHPMTLALLCGYVVGRRPGGAPEAALTKFTRGDRRVRGEARGRRVLDRLFDSLTSTEQEVLTVLSAFRTQARKEDLVAVLDAPADDDAVRDTCKVLEELGLVSRATDGIAETFRLHTIAHEYAYGRLGDPARKRAIHDRLAAHFRTQATTRLRPTREAFNLDPPLLYTADDLAGSIRAAGWPDLDVGIEYLFHLVRAGGASDGLTFYRERLHDQLFLVHAKYDLCAELLGWVTPAGPAADSAGALDDETTVWANALLGTCLSLSGWSDEAAKRFRRVIGLVDRDKRQARFWTAAWCNLGKELFTIGYLSQAKEAFEEAVRRSADSDPVVAAVADDEIGLILAYMGRYAEADEWLGRVEKAVADKPDSRWRSVQVKNLTDQALARMFRGHTAEGFRIADRARMIVNTLDNPDPVHLWTDWVWSATAVETATAGGPVRNEAGREVELAEVERVARAAIATCRATHHSRIECHFLVALGRLRFHLGDPDEAMRLADEALSIGTYCGYRLRQAAAHLLMAEIHRRAGRADDCRTSADKARHLSESPEGEANVRFEYLWSRADRLFRESAPTPK